MRTDWTCVHSQRFSLSVLRGTKNMPRLDQFIIGMMTSSLLTITLSSANGYSSQNYSMMQLYVNKSTLKAELRTLAPPGERSKLLKEFKVAIGKESGDKYREGDNRTPEGIYFSQKHIEEENLLESKYGRLAIPLNFPNRVDKLEGKTGYGIWLHGAGDDNRMKEENVTEGCIAFFNSDILKLEKWLLPNRTAVIIANDLKNVNIPQDVSDVHKRTLSWLNSWTHRKLDQYLSHYGQKFVHKRMNKKRYRSYKKRVFKSYKKMVVKVNMMRVLTHPKYAVSIMNQDFYGDKRFKAIGRKILYWKKENHVWKIVKEHFDREQFSLLAYDKNDLHELRKNRSSVNVTDHLRSSSL